MEKMNNVMKITTYLLIWMVCLQMGMIGKNMQTVEAEQSGDWKYCLINDGTEAEITGYTGIAINVEIPNTLDKYKVTGIGYAAFQDCSSLTSVTIPDGVTNINDYAFYSCSKLENITIPASVTNIGGKAFDRTKWLTDKQTENPLVIVNGILIDGTKCVDAVDIPTSVTSIGVAAFQNCSSLRSVTIPDSVTSIEKWAFSNCKNLTSITIPDSVTSIGVAAFESCKSLRSVTISDSVTSIGAAAFRDCSSLTSITIPDSVTGIGAAAFQDCSSLTSITIPDTVTDIGYNTFYNCNNLTIHTQSDSCAAQYVIENDIPYSYTDIIPVSSLTLSQTVAVLKAGENFSITTAIEPSNATIKKVKWLSGDSAIAKVDENGLVTAVSAGEVTITAKTTDGSNHSAACKITVENPDTPADNLLSVAKVTKFKATAKKKGFTVSWKKVSGVNGYQLQVSTKKNFKGAKTYSISKSKTKYTLSKLKSKTKYYIRIRAYKTYKNAEGKTSKAYGRYVTVNKKTK